MTRTMKERWVFVHYHTGFAINATPAGTRGFVIRPLPNQILRVLNFRFRANSLAADRMLKVAVYEEYAEWDDDAHASFFIWGKEHNTIANNQRVYFRNLGDVGRWGCISGEEFVFAYPQVLSFVSTDMLQNEAILSIDFHMLTNVLLRPTVTVKQSTEDAVKFMYTRGVWKDE